MDEQSGTRQGRLLITYLHLTLERFVFLCVPNLLFWVIQKQDLEEKTVTVIGIFRL